MTIHNNLIPVEKRILFHLLDYHIPKHEYDVPITLTKNGIAQAIGADKDYVSSPIRELIVKGHVQECIGRVKQGKKKQKYFLLTKGGKEYTKKLKSELQDLLITIKQPNGSSKKIKLKDIAPYIEKEEICLGITEMDIYNIVSNDATLDIEHLNKFRKKRFIDFSADAPRLVHFFGRKEEMTSLINWVEEREVNNIIYINGIAGIGKTSLVAKLLEKYRGSKHIFWYNFQKLDTLGGVMFKLSDFLCKIGYDHLEIYLRTRTRYDYTEISKILRETISNIDALMVFDDFHKSNGKTRDFFIYFLKMLASSSKTKMIILSRERIPFYDRRDVRIRKIVAELELEGLDFESCKKILREKGIDKKRYKEIYNITNGNPLFLEFFESGDDLDRYMHDELFSKLGKEERNILGIISIYRFPIPERSLSIYDDFDFAKLYTLTQKSFVKRDAYKRYFIHDIAKHFFYNKLSTSKRRKYHLMAAEWYEKRDEPIDHIEAIYHYQEGGKYEKASQVAIKSSKSILQEGYANEFLLTLESFDDKNLDSNI